MSTPAESQVNLIKRVAPYLDTHVLLHFLKTSVPGTERLQEQLSEKTLISKKDAWQKGQDEETKALEATNPLLALLNNHQEYQRLRQERGFTLEKLNDERGITIGDCKKVFTYAKTQYEMGRYKGKVKILVIPP